MIPVDQPSSQAPWPAPVASTMVRGIEPPIDHSQHPSGSPRRRRLALVAAVLVLLAAVAAVVRVESRQSGATSGSPTATTTTPTKASSGDDTLPTVAALPATQAALDTDAIVALVDPAVADITLALDGGEAAGTGMVLTPSGLLLTNNHVIDGATDITVQIAATGPTHPAHVVGYDIVDDVALLQIEGVSGLMNLVMLPMWVLSGIFFSADRFPNVIQPFIRMLPLTAVIDALRANMLQGQSITQLNWQVAVLIGWLVLGFPIALKLFRWR